MGTEIGTEVGPLGTTTSKEEMVVEIGEDLYERACIEAAGEGITIEEIVENAIRFFLDPHTSTEADFRLFLVEQDPEP